MQTLQLCLLDANGGFTITRSNGLNFCHLRQRRGEPGRAIRLSTSEGSVLTDRRITLSDGRIAHIFPYSPFNQLAVRYDPTPGRYVAGLRGFRESAKVADGETLAIDLTTLDIVYLGHVAPDGSLVWRDPGSLADELRKVPGFSEQRYKDSQPPAMNVSCIAQGADQLRCQAQ